MNRTGRLAPQHEHSGLIEALCERYPGMETRGFWKAVHALVEELDWWDGIREARFKPDAYRINRETQTIEIHEVVRTHFPKKHTLIEMGWFWGDFDAEGSDNWLPALFVHHENSITPAEIDLCHWYHEALAASSFPRLSCRDGAGRA